MKKKSHSIFAVLALALVIAAAIVVFALIRKYTPSKEHEDLTTYYHLTNSDEVAIVLNNEVTSSKARVIDGHIYIDYDFVHDNLNSRFYWDNNENILLYATTQNLISAQAEQTSYMVTKSSADYGRKIVTINSDTAYIDLDFVKETHHDPISFIREQIQNKELIFVTTRFDTECTHHKVYEKCVYEGFLREINHDDTKYASMIILTEITDRYYYTERLQTDVARKTKKVVAMQRSLIGSFATIIEARDGVTGLHLKNTGNFVKILTHAMLHDSRFTSQMTNEYAEMVADAAHLHDIGKISIPDSILQKKGKLTEEEFAIMKSHPVEGARILDETLKGVESDEYFQIAHDMALYHHEKYDGTGYPEGLSGESIPLSARIMAVADVYDALRSSRHYKEGFTREKSVAILKENRGTHFDPDITDIFLDHIDEIENVFEVHK